MNELLADAKSVFLALLALLMSLLSWIGLRQIKRLDDLERDSVTREELRETLAEMREDRQRMHTENQRQLDSIDSTVTGIHQRIDRLLERGTR